MTNTFEFTKKAVKGKKLNKQELLLLVSESKRIENNTRLELYLEKIKALEE